MDLVTNNSLESRRELVKEIGKTFVIPTIISFHISELAVVNSNIPKIFKGQGHGVDGIPVMGVPGYGIKLGKGR
jgi:hypothetical protein